MNETDLNKYREAWKTEQSFERKTLSEIQIQGFLKKRSKDINKLFKTSLVFDIVLKSLIGTSFIFLILLFSGNFFVVLLNALLFAGVLTAILFQIKMVKQIPQADYSTDDLRTILEGKISFYTTKYFKSLYVIALTIPLFVISGITYYFFFKYGEIRSLDLEDFFVFGAIVLGGFLFGLYMQKKQHDFQIKQLEICLTEIDENTISESTINARENRRIQLFLITLLAVICGILVLVYFIFQII